MSPLKKFLLWQQWTFRVSLFIAPLCFIMMIAYFIIDWGSFLGPVAGLIGFAYTGGIFISEWPTLRAFKKIGNLYYIKDSFSAGRFNTRDGYRYHVCNIWDLSNHKIPPQTSEGIEKLLLTHHSSKLVIPYNLGLKETDGDTKLPAMKYPILVFEWQEEYTTPKELKELTANLNYESGRQLAQLLEKEGS